jgi:hypothetical protein
MIVQVVDINIRSKPWPVLKMIILSTYDLLIDDLVLNVPVTDSPKIEDGFGP